MAKLKHYQETISLGKKLIKEFSREESYDTTLQWMAHYIAELIEAAEQERSIPKRRKLQEECAAVILDLWEKRANFRGNTRPLANFADAIPILKALNDELSDGLLWRRFSSYDDGSPWSEFMKSVRHSMDRMVAISLDASLTEEALLKEKDWLDHKTLLSDEEKQIIEHLDHLLTQSDWRIKIIYTSDKDEIQQPETPPDRMTQIFEKFASLISEQEESLSKLKKKIFGKHLTDSE